MMNPLIEWIVTEIRRVLIERIVFKMFGELSVRDVVMILLGMILTLLILGLRDMDKPIIFFHIDKTGGMSLREFLARQFEPDEILPVVHHPEARYQPSTYPTVDTSISRAHHFVEVSIEPQHKLIMGHWDTSILRHLPENITTITVLREPVERFVSLYRFICRERAQYGALSVTLDLVGIRGFAERYQGLYAEMMTRQLAGARWNVVREGYLPFLYQQAVKNLRSMDYVATTDTLTALMLKLAGDFGWGDVEIPMVNQAIAEAVELPRGLADYVREVCTHDVKLYEMACRRQEAWL